MTTTNDVLNRLWAEFEKSGYGSELSIGRCAQELGRVPDDPELKEAVEDLRDSSLIAISGPIQWAARKVGLTARGWQHCAGSIGGVEIDAVKCQILAAALSNDCDGDQLLQRLNVEKRHLKAAVELLIDSGYLDVTRTVGATPFGGFLTIRCTSAGRAARQECSP